MPLGPLKQKLRDTFGEKLRESVAMKTLTTFKIGGPADLLFTPGSEEDIRLMIRMCNEQQVPVTVVGGGSNLLVGDAGIRGVTIWMAGSFMELSHTNHDGEIVLTVGASRTMAETLDYCIDNDIAGLEFISGVPGTFGGGTRMNAGTREGTIGRVAKRVRYIDGDGKAHDLHGDALSFRYRGIEIEGRFTIVRTVLSLKQGDGEKIRHIRDNIIKRRHAKQPWQMPSAGSIFINPEGESAWRLVDESGCRGWSEGAAQVSPKHCNFIVNNGGATAENVLALIERVRRRVFEQSGVLLETEVKVVGERK